MHPVLHPAAAMVDSRGPLAEPEEALVGLGSEVNGDPLHTGSRWSDAHRDAAVAGGSQDDDDVTSAGMVGGKVSRAPPSANSVSTTDVLR